MIYDMMKIPHNIETVSSIAIAIHSMSRTFTKKSKMEQKNFSASPSVCRDTLSVNEATHNRNPIEENCKEENDVILVSFQEFEIQPDGNSILRRTVKIDVQNQIKNISPNTSNFGILELNSPLLLQKVQNLLVTIKGELFRMFLPIGYPYTVRKEYTTYQICDTIQGLLTYLRGMASTAAILKSSGVGSAEANALSASLSWAVRDGIGMLGGLIFSYIASPYFDAYVKEFRLFADIVNNIALSVDISLPILSKINRNKFIFYSSVSTICKVMCGMAAGATKSSISAHFALHGNLADVNAKENAQETLVTLIGMIVGLGMSTWLNDHYIVGIVIFFALTALHLIVNYYGVVALRLRTLNYQRAHCVINEFVINESRLICSRLMKTNLPDENLPVVAQTPEQVNESIYDSVCYLIWPKNVRVDRRPDWKNLPSTFDSEMKQVDEERYFLILGETSPAQVDIMLRSGATVSDEWRAFVHSQILFKVTNEYLSNGGNSLHPGVRNDLIKVTHDAMKKVTSKEEPLSLDSLSKQGWKIDRLYLGFGKWRVDVFKKEL